MWSSEIGALLDRFAAEGLQIESTDDGKLRVTGRLTDKLSDAIRAHKPQLLAELGAANGEFLEQYARTHAREGCDEDTLRRQAKAIAMLDADPGKRVAIVAEAGDPAHVAVAIRGVAVGELTIPAERYDAFALLALMEQCGHA
jgi:hypothetical protein